MTNPDDKTATSVAVAPSIPPPDKLLGRTIDGRYLVEDVLGEGGMGLVYRARHTVLNKRIAIKVLRQDVSKDEEIIRRFRQEAQSATAIGNQHIIDIIDFGTLPDASTYFVMEYLDGKDLTRVIEEEAPLSQAKVVHIAKQLCRALGAAHEVGIVHRDLKPDNIYLVKRGEDSLFVKVLDFGIAKVGTSNTNKLTRQGQIFGTPHYMSPEQCAGSNTDQRTDIYALGVILYEMATGSVPFNADSLMGILTKHMYEMPPAPSTIELSQPVDPELEAIILKCLVKDPAHRYQTMGELHADLERLHAGLPPEAAVSGVAEFEPYPLSGTQRVRGGSPLKNIALGAVIVAVIVSVVALVARPKPAPTAAPAPPAAATAPAAQPPPSPQAPAAEEPKAIALSSIPSGASVFEGEQLIANTPANVDLPPAGEDKDLVLRLHGFKDLPVKILHSSRDLEVRMTKLEGPKTKRSKASGPRVNSDGVVTPEGW